MTDALKPPPIVVAPSGIEAKPVHTPDGQLDLARLCRYPPYQMYVEEREPNFVGMPADAYAQQRTQQAIHRGELPQWLEKYVAWHSAKGYWKGEDPIRGAA